MPSFQTANYIEAALWILIALVFLASARNQERRNRCLFAAIAFAMFGVSDIVEASTGAWWRPWWLLVWKALCIACMLGLLAGYVIRRRRQQSRGTK